MTAELPDSVAAEFLRAWRKKRLQSVLLWSPIISVIVGVLFVGFLLLRGHALVHLLGKFFGSERAWLMALAAAIPVALIGGVVVAYAMVRDCRVTLVPFCPRCHRAQHLLSATCEVCGDELFETRRYVYIPYDDEKAIARFYGLRDEVADEQAHAEGE
jgi:hypothetical protein